jgi:hypothetical protein
MSAKLFDKKALLAIGTSWIAAAIAVAILLSL